jgi:hypothetical protein
LHSRKANAIRAFSFYEDIKKLNPIALLSFIIISTSDRGKLQEKAQQGMLFAVFEAAQTYRTVQGLLSCGNFNG